MIERHYAHLQSAQKVNVIAGKRIGTKKKPVANDVQVEEKTKLELVK